MRQLNMHFLTLYLLFVCIPCLASDTVTEIYTPSHKPASSLLSIIKPLYDNEASLSATDTSLIIRAEEPLSNQIQELLLQLDHPDKTFFVEISDKHSSKNTVTYSTTNRSTQQQIFKVTENATLSLVKQTLSQQVTTRFPIWQAVENIPVKQESIKLRLQSAQDHVYIDLSIVSLNNSEYSERQQRISGPLEQWLTINTSDHKQHRPKTYSTMYSTTYSTTNSTTNATTGATRTWKTHSTAGSELYIKVTPIR